MKRILRIFNILFVWENSTCVLERTPIYCYQYIGLKVTKQMKHTNVWLGAFFCSVTNFNLRYYVDELPTRWSIKHMRKLLQNRK